MSGAYPDFSYVHHIEPHHAHETDIPAGCRRFFLPPLNTGSATVRGVEFAYRQSLTFLPAWAKGVQVFANATRLEVEGSNAADFTGFNPKTYAALGLDEPKSGSIMSRRCAAHRTSNSRCKSCFRCVDDLP